jgi:DNA-binding transcriptional MerR regulator
VPRRKASGRTRQQEARTVGRLAREFGLSRSTLLYYDRIGLLEPSGRTASGYRRYAPADVERLRAICRYREAGIRLRDIARLLDGGGGATAVILERRLESLNEEIGRLREQQRVVVGLLRDRRRLRRARALDKRSWTELLRATGLDEDGMRRWHVEFERMSPRAHQDFLESLGIPPREIASIRKWSRATAASRLP